MNRTSQQSKKPMTTSSSNTTSDAIKKSTNLVNVSLGTSDEIEEKLNNPGNSCSNITSTNSNTKDETDVYEFHVSKESSGPSGEEKVDALKVTGDKLFDDKNATDTDSSTTTTSSNSNTGPGPKRQFTEVEGTDDQTGINVNESDEIKRKKRKEGESIISSKDSSSTSGKSGTNVRVPIKQEKGNKIPGPASKTLNIGVKTAISSDIKKSPCPSPKPAITKSTDSDAEQEDGNTGASEGPPKVPPLKIVIPQQSNSGDAGETGNLRNGKNASTRSHQALPYVVASSNR